MIGTRILCHRSIIGSRMPFSSNAHKIPHVYDLGGIEEFDFKIVKSKPTKSPENLVASLEFSGYLPDHLDFIASLAKILTDKSDITTTPIISKPTIVKRINTLVSPFVHSKTKNVFEQKTHIRALQIYDTHLDNVKGIVDALIKIMPPGINLKVDKFHYTCMKDLVKRQARLRAENSISNLGNSFEEKVLKRKDELIKEFSNKK